MIRNRVCGLVGIAMLSGCAGRVIEFTSGTGGTSSIGGSTSTTGGMGASGTDVGGSGPFEGCSATNLPSDPTRPGYTASRDPQVAALLGTMLPEEKIKQMYGVLDPPTRDGVAYGDIQRGSDVQLNSGKTLRGFKFRDAGRGVDLEARQPDRPTQNKDYSTAFPAESARAASWDLELEMQVGEAIADETMVSKNNMLLAPCMNILRHPYWGRSQETYGEDTYHVGRMASALIAGIQQHVAACAKHFALNNIENGRANENATVNEQTLREVYLPHFEMAVKEAGVACVMAAYNKVNSIKCTQNRHLLSDILKAPVAQNGFGFRGLVVSDWWAMPGDSAPQTDMSQAAQTAIEALNAGLDVEMPWALHYSQLGNLVDNGTVSMGLINEAAGRILEQKFRFGTAYTSDPYGLGTATTKLSGDSITNNQTHLDLAEESEIRSAVLLTNGTGGTPVLPIAPGTASIAVVGMDVPINIATSTNLQPGDDGVLQFATEINTGDRGTSRIDADPATSIGPFAGISSAAAGHGITAVTSGNSVDAATAADLVVVVVGLTAGDEGEEYSTKTYGDRSSLDLPAGQANFVSQVLDLGKPTVIIVESGSIVNLPWLAHSNQNQATIWAGYAGQRAGAAFGKLLFGDRNFSGKMPVSWPREVDLNRMLPFRDSTDSVTMGYYHGYRMYDKAAATGQAVNLVFPFGHGLSYTKYAYSNLQVPCQSIAKSNVAAITADVTNVGSVAGDEVVMMFVKGPPAPAGIVGERPVKELKAFQRVSLQPGASAHVTLPLSVQALRHWEGAASGKWVIDPGTYTILVGPSAAELPLTATITVEN